MFSLNTLETLLVLIPVLAAVIGGSIWFMDRVAKKMNKDDDDDHHYDEY